MDSIIPAKLSRYPLVSDSTDTLLELFPIEDGGAFIVYERSLVYSKPTSISPYKHQLSSPIVAASLLYQNLLLYVTNNCIYECHATEGGLSTSLQLQLTGTCLSAETFCIATSSAGLLAYCALSKDCSLTIMIYEDACTRALPDLRHLCTVVHQLELPATASPCKLKASFDPTGLLLAIHASTKGDASYLLVLGDASSSHFDATFAKQLNFSSELRAQFEQELSRDRPGWVPCSWRKQDRSVEFHGFTTEGRFLLMTCRAPTKSESGLPSASEAHAACCKKTTDSAAHECACTTSITQKYIPYEGRGIALESNEDVSWTPSSYMEEHGDLEWYKQYYGIPKGFSDNLTFSANTAAVYPFSVCLYDPLVLRNPHIVFPLRVPSPGDDHMELVLARGVRLGQGHHVLVLHRGQGFYRIAVYMVASYTWWLAFEVMIPCCPGLLHTPSHVSEDGRVLCVTSPHVLLSTTLHAVLQQSFTGSFSRIQDGMVLYTDLASFCIPPPAYNSCVLRTTEPLVATCIIQRCEPDIYVAALTRTKLFVILVTPFESLALPSEAPKIAGDTSFIEQEMLIKADSDVARVMKGNKKAHFQALNDLEDGGQRNSSYDIITKEELLVDPFRSDHLQEHILTHTSATLLELDLVSQLDADLLGSLLAYGGHPLLFPVALQGPMDITPTESKSLTVQLLGMSVESELTIVTLRAELTLIPAACSLHSISVFANREWEYTIPLPIPRTGLTLERSQRCFCLGRLTKEQQDKEQETVNSLGSVVSFSEFSSYYWVLREESVSTTPSWLLFAIPRAHSQLLVYTTDSHTSEHVYEPIYSCNIEPWSTILYATELSVTLYARRGYLDVRRPSTLSYFRAQSLLKQALSPNPSSSMNEVLEVCFESRLLLSSLCRNSSLSKDDIVTYFRLLLSSNPSSLLRALEAVVCPREMKTPTAITFGRYNTTEKHEADFWASLVRWIFENIGQVKDTAAKLYKDEEKSHEAYLKSLLRILQLYATYHSGLTMGFGYQNRGGQERIFTEISASFASAYIAAPDAGVKPSLTIFITHLASAATSYQMNLVQLLQAIELFLFQRARYVDMQMVANAMGLSINVVTVSCFGMKEKLFSKCQANGLLKACAYLVMASNGVYAAYTQEDLATFYDLNPSAVFPFVSSTARRYQCMSVFTGLDIGFCLISKIFTLLSGDVEAELNAEVSASTFKFAGWSRRQVALGAVHYIKKMMDINMALLAEVLHEYPLEEYIIRLVTSASKIDLHVVTALLESFLPVVERLKNRSAANQIYLLLDATIMAVQLRATAESGQLSGAGEYEKDASDLQTIQLQVCEELKLKSQTDPGIQHVLVHAMFTALSTPANADSPQENPEILSDLRDVEMSDALIKTLHSLLIHRMVSASQLLQFLKCKLITEGVDAAEAGIIAQMSEISALHEQYQAVRTKMDKYIEKHGNKIGKNARLHQLDERMKKEKEELESRSSQIHNYYKNFAVLLCFCASAPFASQL